MLDIETEESEVAHLNVIDLDTIVLSSLHVHFLLCSLDTVAHLPDVDDGVTIDDEAHLVVAVDVEDDGLILGGDKGSIEAGREFLQIHPWGKNGVATIAEHDGSRDVHGGCRGTAHVGVIIIGGLHAFAAERIPQFPETALKDFVPSQSAAADESGLRCQLMDAFKGSDGTGGKS